MKKDADQPLQRTWSRMLCKQRFLTTMAVSLLVVILSSSCGGTPSPEPLDERVRCEGESGTFSCSGLSDHEIKLEGVPDGVTPYLLTVTPEYRDFLLGPDAKKSEETTCIFMLAGDLAFYDDKGELVTGFDNPVTIEYSFLSQDEEAFRTCQETVAERAGIATEEVKYVPVYYDQELWKPFKNAVVETESGLMTITFASWGDQPIGSGSQP